MRAIHLGHRLTAIEERNGRIVLAFDNGAQVEAEYVIAAGGVRSVIRRALYGDDNFHDLYGADGVARVLLNASDVPAELVEPNRATCNGSGRGATSSPI